MSERVATSRAALKALYSEDAEARRYVVEGVVYFGLIHAHLAAVVVGWVPAWTMAVLLPIWMARTMIGRHELIHVRKEGEVDLFTSLWPVLMMVTPFSAGYREYRVLHQRHHQFMLTDRDPDAYQYRGGVLAGYLHCFLSPEVTLWSWVKEKGLDAQFAREVVLRALFFTAVVAVSGRAFLWYWVPLRMTYGASLFLFSYVLHRRGREVGVFRIDLSPVGVQAFCFLFGKVGWLAVCNHDVHHANSNLSPLRLRDARPLLGARVQ